MVAPATCLWGRVDWELLRSGVCMVLHVVAAQLMAAALTVPRARPYARTRMAGCRLVSLMYLSPEPPV